MFHGALWKEKKTVLEAEGHQNFHIEWHENIQ